MSGADSDADCKTVLSSNVRHSARSQELFKVIEGKWNDYQWAKVAMRTRERRKVNARLSLMFKGAAIYKRNSLRERAKKLVEPLCCPPIGTVTCRLSALSDHSDDGLGLSYHSPP